MNFNTFRVHLVFLVFKRDYYLLFPNSERLRAVDLPWILMESVSRQILGDDTSVPNTAISSLSPHSPKSLGCACSRSRPDFKC